METLYLVGFSGVGKTIIGKLIASRREQKFLDTDNNIVEKENKSLNDIWISNGEGYFRDLEKYVIDNGVSRGMVVSVGTYIPKDDGNRLKIKTTGKVLYLKSKSSTIYENLKDDYVERPFLKNNFSIFEIEDKLNEMKPYYEELSNYTIDIDNKNVNDVFKEALAIYNYINKVKFHIFIK